MHMKEALLSHPHTLRSLSHSWPWKPISLIGTKNRVKEDKVLLFFLLEKQSVLIYREMLLITPPQYIPSHPLFPSVEQHPSTGTHTHASRYLDRDALLSAAELLGVCVCICVCVWMFSWCHQTGRRKFPPAALFYIWCFLQRKVGKKE